ncbi:hypothetical protein GCK72_019820 [Caenorhabditis remanei]|uniref:Uncharacterized protein n=1 Tax=Caenorhabditis remanei TaxID=31234 RepID=A0A6A5GEU9_CAERE|nr:hypothetical protein GCK72_019820 [Caenorhabditis remanei]KAF1753264.1 hypothetical protein GCK72_019820 [Caenorhabditis remanei]
MAFFSFRQFLGLIGVILTAWILNKGQHILMFALDDFSENYTTFLGEKWWSTEQLGLCDDETLDVLWQRNASGSSAGGASSTGAASAAAGAADSSAGAASSSFLFSFFDHSGFPSPVCPFFLAIISSRSVSFLTTFRLERKFDFS